MISRSKLISALLLLFAVMHFVPDLSAQKKTKKQRNYEYDKLRAEVAFIEHDYDKSIRLYTNLYNRTKNTFLLIGRGDSYYAKKEYDNAISDWMAVIKVQTATIEVYEKLVKANRAKGDKASELQAIKNANERYDNTKSRQMLSDYYARNPGSGDQAVSIESAFKQLQLENFPTVEKYTALNNLVLDAEELKNYDLLLEIINYGIEECEFDRAVKPEPLDNWWNDMSEGYTLRKCGVYIIQGKRNEAISIANEVCENSSNPLLKGGAYVTMAEAYLLNGNYDQAILFFRKGTALLDVRYYNCFQLLGESYYRINEFGSARRVFKSLSEINESQSLAKAYLSLTNILEYGDPADLSVIQKLINENPADGRFNLILARGLAALDSKEQSIVRRTEILTHISAALKKGEIRPAVLELSMMELELALRTERGQEILANNNLEHLLTPVFQDDKEIMSIKPLYTGDEKRLALIIGNGDYQHGGALLNPENDAKDMNSMLSALGFEVMYYANVDQTNMKRAMDLFGSKLKSYEVGLFFYAGHGLQAKGTNYLIPVDAEIENESDVEFTCVDAGRILTRMEDADNRINIIILDACRNNPFERSWTRSSSGKGLAKMDAPTGSIIAYATQPGNTASDGTGENGLYTEALLEEMQNPGLIIERVFRQVRTKVIERSGEVQIPWESTSLTGDFYFLEE